MREIKFRIFEYNKMHYPKQYKENKFDNYFIDLNGELKYYQNCYDGGFFDTENAKLMQFTGLHDKNGKEIYEGDIAKVEKIDLAQIIWDEDRMAWGIKPINDFYFDSPLLADNTDLELEIIGNIYENPELLERSSNGD